MFHVIVTDRATGVTHFNQTTRKLDDLFIEVRREKARLFLFHWQQYTQYSLPTYEVTII